MNTIKNTNLYFQVLKELNYDFGNVFIFKNFIVSEINSNVVFTWDNHAKLIAEDVSSFLGTDGSNLIYISNRINSYSVMATDWIKFFKNSYSLKGYYVVGNQKTNFINIIFENLFFNSKIKQFTTLEAATTEAIKNQTELVSI